MPSATRSSQRQQSQKKVPLKDCTNKSTPERRDDVKDPLQACNTTTPERRDDVVSYRRKPRQCSKLSDSVVSEGCEIVFEEATVEGRCTPVAARSGENDLDSSSPLRNRTLLQPSTEVEFSLRAPGGLVGNQEPLVLYHRRGWRPNMPKPSTTESVSLDLPTLRWIHRTRRRSSSSWHGSYRGRRSSASSAEVPLAPTSVDELLAETSANAIPPFTAAAEAPKLHKQLRRNAAEADWVAKQRAFFQEVDEEELEVESPSPIKTGHEDNEDPVLLTPSPDKVSFVLPLAVVPEEEESYAEESEASETTLAPGTLKKGHLTSSEVIITGPTSPVQHRYGREEGGQSRLDPNYSEQRLVDIDAALRGVGASDTQLLTQAEEQLSSGQRLVRLKPVAVAPLPLEPLTEQDGAEEEAASASAGGYRFVSLKPVTATFGPIAEEGEDEDEEGAIGGPKTVADIVARFEKHSAISNTAIKDRSKNLGCSIPPSAALREKQESLKQLHVSPGQPIIVPSPPRSAHFASKEGEGVQSPWQPGVTRTPGLLPLTPQRKRTSIPSPQLSLQLPPPSQHAMVSTPGPEPITPPRRSQRAPQRALTSLRMLMKECGQKAVKSMGMTMGEFCDPKEVVKIGEGSFGEIFAGNGQVFKMMPFGGSTLVNGELQRTVEEILDEIKLTNSLRRLRDEDQTDHYCSHFIETRGVKMCKGRYDKTLVQEWENYTVSNFTDNDPPQYFPADQYYVMFIFAHGGKSLEDFVINSYEEARVMLLQLTVALAVGEASCDFEHRDLHHGNILLKREPQKTETRFRLRGRDFRARSLGLYVSIIDFTLSRITDTDGRILFNDLSVDPTLFEQPAGNQGDTYRAMRVVTQDCWERRVPKTNCLWLRFVVEHLLREKSFPHTTRETKELSEFSKRLQAYHSAEAAVNDSLFGGLWLGE